MKTPLLTALLLVGIASSTAAQTSPTHSFTLTAGTATQVFSAPLVNNRVFQRIINVGTSGVAWCSRFDQAPGPNKAGSYPLAPYGNSLGLPSVEEFQAPGYVPQFPVYCTADSGTATITGESAP